MTVLIAAPGSFTWGGTVSDHVSDEAFYLALGAAQPESPATGIARPAEAMPVIRYLRWWESPMARPDVGLAAVARAADSLTESPRAVEDEPSVEGFHVADACAADMGLAAPVRLDHGEPAVRGLLGALDAGREGQGDLVGGLGSADGDGADLGDSDFVVAPADAGGTTFLRSLLAGIEPVVVVLGSEASAVGQDMDRAGVAAAGLPAGLKSDAAASDGTKKGKEKDKTGLEASRRGDPAPTPEPATIFLMAAGGLAVVAGRRRRRTRRRAMQRTG